MQMAQDRALQSALLNKVVRPQVTDEAVKARYDEQCGRQAGEPEVHARHILVGDEATAKKIIAELKKGGDFAALSKQYSKDPSASQQGGDLGFFKKGDMVPEFADVAFALKDNEVTPVPVQTQFGWHVIQTLEHRTDAPPTFEQVHDELRQTDGPGGGAEGGRATHAAEVTVERFNPDGSPVKATDTAEPPSATDSRRPPSLNQRLSSRRSTPPAAEMRTDHGNRWRPPCPRWPCRCLSCRRWPGFASPRPRRASAIRDRTDVVMIEALDRQHGCRGIHLEQMPRRADRLVPGVAERRARLAWWW